uniref:Nucleoporin_N domain-containing protein n=1 Tax=Steinernema glaseri TaxID=37863 RepID=A0A1I8ARW5_9BILA
MDAEFLLRVKEDRDRLISSIVVAGNFAYVASHGKFSFGHMFSPQHCTFPCIDVYDIRTKQQIVLTDDETLSVPHFHKTQLYKDGNKVKLLVGSIGIHEYEVVFDVQTKSLTSMLKSSISYDESIMTSFKLLSSGVLKAESLFSERTIFSMRSGQGIVKESEQRTFTTLIALSCAEREAKVPQCRMGELADFAVVEQLVQLVVIEAVQSPNPAYVGVAWASSDAVIENRRFYTMSQSANT